nr:hypothetical protein [Clostridiales bacterium]
ADEDTLNKMTEGIFDKGRFLINNDFVTFLVPVSRFNIGMYGTWRVEMPLTQAKMMSVVDALGE